jgi:ankyrin repeat protein
MNHGSHVKALLEAGALPDAVDIYGDTPLHMAVSYGYSDLIPIFVRLVDRESLTRTLATHNMYGQRPIDMAQVRFVPSLSPLSLDPLPAALA